MCLLLMFQRFWLMSFKNSLASYFKSPLIYLLGLLESPLMPHEDSLQVMAVLDEVRKQIGVIYESDLC